MSEVIQKGPELKRKVMRPINEKKRERERESYYLAYPLIDAPETDVFIAICSMNIHLYDFSHFLVPHVSSGLATG